MPRLLMLILLLTLILPAPAEAITIDEIKTKVSGMTNEEAIKFGATIAGKKIEGTGILAAITNSDYKEFKTLLLAVSSDCIVMGFVSNFTANHSPIGGYYKFMGAIGGVGKDKRVIIGVKDIFFTYPFPKQLSYLEVRKLIKKRVSANLSYSRLPDYDRKRVKWVGRVISILEKSPREDLKLVLFNLHGTEKTDAMAFVPKDMAKQISLGDIVEFKARIVSVKKWEDGWVVTLFITAFPDL